MKVTQEIPLITGSYANSTASVAGTTSPFRNHSARGSGHDFKGHAAYQRRQFGAAEDRAGRFLARREADGFGRHLDQQALHQDHRADRGRRHHRARRTDVGYGDRERGSGARTRRHSHHRQPVQVAQRLEAEEEPDGVHSSENPARRRIHRKHQRSDIQRSAAESANSERRPHHLVAGTETARCARDSVRHRHCRRRRRRRKPIRWGPRPTRRHRRRRLHRTQPPGTPPSNERGTARGRTATQAVVSVREAPRHLGARHRRRRGGHRVPPGRDAAKPWRKCAASSAFP